MKERGKHINIQNKLFYCIVAAVSFWSFRFGGFGRFVSTFRVLLHASQRPPISLKFRAMVRTRGAIKHNSRDVLETRLIYGTNR